MNCRTLLFQEGLIEVALRRATVKLIPNILTTLRLLLVVPICLLILSENYPPVLWIALIAGLSDAVDGWLARRLGCVSRYGAIADPLIDKTLLISVYSCLMIVAVLPWWIFVIIVTRDVVIVSGAFAYHWLCGRYDIKPSFWGKASTAVQISFALMLLTQQVFQVFPVAVLQVTIWLLILLAFVSGGHYVYTWGAKARALQRSKL